MIGQHEHYLKQLPVGDEAVIVHVVDAEGEAQLGQLVALNAELRHALDELLEIHLRHNTGDKSKTVFPDDGLAQLAIPIQSNPSISSQNYSYTLH